MRVLGIETSCDETGIAIFDDQKGILSHQLYSQVKLHADYGGVVPELASRDHVRKTIPLIQAALKEAGLGKDDIDGIAYTAGPGLVGAILVGATIGRSLAMAWDKPAIAVHHMEGHLLAPMLEERAPEFPFVALLVSGGHSMLVRVDGIGSYQLLGESIDDAAGEAFDKTAKLMGLDYPGGPLLSRLAEKGTTGRFTFPRPMTDRPGLDMSFSGLKTFAANTIAANGDDEQTRADIARAFRRHDGRTGHGVDRTRCRYAGRRQRDLVARDEPRDQGRAGPAVYAAVLHGALATSRCSCKPEPT